MRTPRPRPLAAQRGAALVIAILVLAILTVIGIALMLITSTESQIAANEWSVNRAFYASDAGIRWATVEMLDPEPFMARPEFTPAPSAAVRNGPLRLPSQRTGPALLRRWNRGGHHRVTHPEAPAPSAAAIPGRRRQRGEQQGQ